MTKRRTAEPQEERQCASASVKVLEFIPGADLQMYNAETHPHESTRLKPMVFYLTHNLDMAVIWVTYVRTNERLWQ